MNPTTDNKARLQALAPGRSFIVQAPAGSGKTELLIRRFITLLGTVKEPEEIVAITFTRKAAAEMKNRVLTALLGAQERPPAGEAEGELWELAQAAWENNQRREWNLDQHPNRMRIQTIDALCAALTRQMPWLSRFGAPLQVMEDATELYRVAALETLRLVVDSQREWRQAITVVLGHLDNQVNRAVDLLVEMMRFRDQWLRHLGSGAQDAEAWQRRRLESSWAQIVRQELSTVRELVPRQLEEDILQCAVFAAGQLAAKGSDSPIVNWESSDKFVGDQPGSLARWQGLRELCLTNAGDWRRQVNIRNGFPATKVGKAAIMKERMIGLLQSLSAHEQFRAALDRVKLIPPVSFEDGQWRVLAALTRLLPLAAARLNLLFAERAQVDFAEINMRANSALGSLDSPTDLALRLDHQISHLLVDEFQDTSLTQFELIRQLTSGWMEDDGRTLFLVGDPMQSIYRFREAEVGLFQRVRERGLGNLKPVSLTLSANFRSDQSIVSWVNDVFAGCFPDEPNLDRGVVGYSPSSSHIPAMPRAGVTFHALRDASEQDEAQNVVEVIRQTRRRNRKERVAVLVRSRLTLRAILPALDKAGISYAGLDIERLAWQPVVQDLLSLTRALLYPADRIAWLSILRAPWCGLALDDLYRVAHPNTHVCIWERLCDEETFRNLSADGKLRLCRFTEVIGNALANRGRLDMRRWIENTWIGLGGPACIDSSDEINARTYFELLSDHARAGEVVNLGDFSRLVDERWSHTEDRVDQHVQVMTIHKAKGLEFDTVIIPGLNRQPRVDDSKLLLWEETIQGENQSLLLAPLAEVGGVADPHYRYLRAVHNEKEHYETLRLLYVGCTRARRALHLSAIATTRKDGSLQKPVGQSLLAPLWPTVQAEFDLVRHRQFELFTAKSNAAIDSQRSLRRLPVGWIPPAYPTPVGFTDNLSLQDSSEEIEFSWAGEVARHIGVVVHEMLDNFAQDGCEAWPVQRLSGLENTWQRRLMHLGVPHDEAKRGSQRILSALLTVLDDERGKWLFSTKHSDARSELAISAREQGSIRNYRIDRTFVDTEGIRWIVDFKSSAHEGGGLKSFLDREQDRYRPQLEGYARALSMLDSRPIRLGLYFPLIRGWREWPFESR